MDNNKGCSLCNDKVTFHKYIHISDWHRLVLTIVSGLFYDSQS